MKAPIWRIIAFAFVFASISSAAAPDLREQVSLDGTWTFTPNGASSSTITVPEFWDAAPGFGTSIKKATYERSVSVPNAYAGKQVKIEFEGVNQHCEVFVGSTLIGTHTGGWIPFSFDITSHVTAGSSFQLKVVVDNTVSSITNRNWPIGWYGHQQQFGIAHSVWLRAYGTVHIEDAFIKTSVTDSTITVDYRVRNTTGSSKTVLVTSDIVVDGQSTIVKSLTSSSTSIPANSTATITATAAWTNAAKWNPETPNLYVITSLVKENSTTLDTEKRRFGFREFKISGNQYYLNGTRVNLRGTSVIYFGQNYNGTRYTRATPSTWGATLDAFKSTLHHNVLRTHQSPAPKWAYDLADEKGMLMIAESAIYARDYGMGTKATYISNANSWLANWVKAYRNHPSIIQWSAANETSSIWFSWFTNAEQKAFADVIRANDTTRTVIHDGDKDLGGTENTFNWHYIEGYESSPSGSIYGWANKVQSSKPTGIGEFITAYGSNVANNKYWQGTWTRGCRYVGFADLRPYVTGWAVNDPSDAAVPNLAASYNPIALFDKSYDDLGIGPIKNASYPSLNEGANVVRTLVLYNDAFSDTTISVEVKVKSGGITYASGTSTQIVSLGDKAEFTISFQVPYVGGSTMDLELTTKKGGNVKFSETKKFNVTETGTGTSSSVITFGESGPITVAFWKFDESSGNASDSSGNGFTGTLSGNASYSSGTINNALALDGNGDFVTVGDNALLDFTNAIKVDARIQFAANAGTAVQKILEKNNPSNAALAAYIIRVSDAGKIGLLMNGDGLWKESNALSWSNGVWYHIVVTYNGSTVSFERDGQSVGSVNYSGSAMNTSGPLYIGKGSPGWERYFNGKIDELKLLEP